MSLDLLEGTAPEHYHCLGDKPALLDGSYTRLAVAMDRKGADDKEIQIQDYYVHCTVKHEGTYMCLACNTPCGPLLWSRLLYREKVKKLSGLMMKFMTWRM